MKSHFWRPANSDLDKALIRISNDAIVLLDDIEPLLVVMNDKESKRVLIGMMFEYLGFPPLNKSLFISMESEVLTKHFYHRMRNHLSSFISFR